MRRRSRPIARGVALALVCVAVLLPAAGRAQAPAPESPEARLFAAIDQNKAVLAEGMVLRRQVDVNARDEHRETPLHRAIEKGMLELARLLIAGGANLRARSATGETALHVAALHEDPAPVQMVLAAGADPKARNDAGETALFWAALTGNARTVQALLAAGADAEMTDLRGNGPLHGAADGGHAEVVRLLLPRITEPKGRNRDGQSAGDLARARGERELGRLIDEALAGPPPAAAPAGR